MKERAQDPGSADLLDDVFEPAFSDLIEESAVELPPSSSVRRSLMEKRRRAELLIEQRRLRDELGDYDLDLELDNF